MNAMDFLQELSEIDDCLLLKAATVPSRKHSARKMGLRIALVAALISLLAMTATAVTVGVRIIADGGQILNHDRFLSGGYNHYTPVATVEYELRAQDVSLPLLWTEELTKAWKSFGYDYRHFTGIELRDEQGRRICYGGISEIEGLLDVNLLSGEKLENAVRGAYVTLVVTDQERAAEQLRTEGMVSPDGIVLYFPFDLNKAEGVDIRTVDYCGLTIYLPLTRSFADKYAIHNVVSAIAKQNLKQSDLTSKGKVEVVLLENTKEQDSPMNGYAAYGKSGIGYLMELKTQAGVTALPGELLLPYVEELEE